MSTALFVSTVATHQSNMRIRVKFSHHQLRKDLCRFPIIYHSHSAIQHKYPSILQAQFLIYHRHVIQSNVAVSGLLERCCDSAHTASDSVEQAGLSEEVCDSSHSASDPVVPTADATASVSDLVTIAITNSQTSSEYSLAAKNVISFLKKTVSKEEGASITASFREIDQAFPRVFLLTHKGAFCRVCSNTTISLSGQRNPFGNAKQRVESKGHKAKMQVGSSIVSSKDISLYFLAPPQNK